MAAAELTSPFRAPYNEPASGSSSAVERLLAKEEVGSSNLLFRSTPLLSLRPSPYVLDVSLLLAVRNGYFNESHILGMG